MKPDEKPMAVRVANYLFCQMCCHSEAGYKLPEIEIWYQDALEFFETLIAEKAEAANG